MKKYLQHRFALSEKGASDMIQAFAACAVNNVILMLPAGLLYRLIDDLMGNRLSENIMFYGIGIPVCFLLIFCAAFWQYNTSFFSTYIESGVRRISLAEKLRKLPLSFFGKKDLSDLTSTIMADCARIETASSHWIPKLIGSILSTSLISLGLFFIDGRMAAAALWVLPISFCIVLFSTRVQDALSRRQMEAKLSCADGIQECLESVRDLRTNHAEEAYLVGLDRKIRAVERRAIISELGTAVFVASAQMILKLGIATVALTGSVLLANGSIDLLTFFLFLLLVSRFYEPLQSSLENLAAIIATQVQCDRMNEILEHPVQSGAEVLKNEGYDIVFENVTFAYNGDEPVLNGVSFTAKQGEVTALIGPSGSGKTTISRLAARFWDIDSGRITVGGMNVSETEPETLMSLYSIVFQDITLFNNTVMENIRIGRKDASDEEVLAAAKLAHVDEFARRMPDGWNTLIGENGSELSGGERQRISIARAFLKNAPIILLDEATASLDAENETLIQESLAKLIQNKTVLIIAHRMRTVAGADKVVVLKNGCVAEQGSPEELWNRDGIYRRMAKLQTQNQGWVMKT